MKHPSSFGKASALAAVSLAIIGLLLLLPGATAGFVAVGDNGEVRTSPNGVLWTSRTSGVTADLNAVTFGSGMAVAVGSGGTILTSADGESWTKQCPAGSGTGCPPTSALLRAVAHDAGDWVVVGDGVTILTSSNGSAWTARTANATGDLFAVTRGDSQWIALGRSPPPVACGLSCWDRTLMLFSAAGTTWDGVAMNGNSDHIGYGITVGGGRWVAMGTDNSLTDMQYFSGLSPVTSSTTSSSNGGYAGGGAGTCRAVVYATSKFVAPCGSRVFRSPNGQSPWSSSATVTGNAIAHDGGNWTIVGTSGNAATSADASAWTTRTTGTSEDLNGLAVLPNRAPVNAFNGATFAGGPPGNAAQSTSKDTDLVFSTANGNRITVTDPDGVDDEAYRVTLAATTGSLSLGSTSGLSFACLADVPLAGLPACSGSGSSQASMTFDGSFANVNAALSGMAFTPAAGTCDPTGSTITITTHDEGHHGPGNDLWDQDTVTVTVMCPPPTCTAAPAAVLMGQTTTFTASPGRPPYTWSSPGSSLPATGAGATHARSYAAFGTKTVTVTDSSTPAQSGTCTVQVVDTLSCSPASQSVRIGQTATITAAGGKAPHSWTTAGTDNDGPVPGATWSGASAQAGTYSVRVDDADPAQDATCSLVVVPDLACTILPNPIVEGQSSTLAATGPPGPYTWTATGGAPATGLGATLTASYDAGTHAATVTSTDPAQSASCLIQVRPRLSCSASLAYVGRPATLTAAGGTGTYSWTTAGLPATGIGVVLAVTYGTVGTRSVAVQDQGPPVQTATCLVDVRSALDYPGADQGAEGRGHMAPIASIRLLQGPCGDWQVQLVGAGSTDADGNVVAWNWNLPGGTITGGRIATHTLPGPGVYVAFLEVKDDDGLTGWAIQTFSLRDCKAGAVPGPGLAPPLASETTQDPAACAKAMNAPGCPARDQGREGPRKQIEPEVPETETELPEMPDEESGASRSSDLASQRAEAAAEPEGLPLVWAVGGTAGLAVLAFVAGISVMAWRKRR